MSSRPTVFEQIQKMIRHNPAPLTVGRHAECAVKIARMFPNDDDNLVNDVRLQHDFCRSDWMAFTFLLAGKPYTHFAIVWDRGDGFSVHLMDYVCNRHASDVKRHFTLRLVSREQFVD